jgi:hypothetical protein
MMGQRARQVPVSIGGCLQRPIGVAGADGLILCRRLVLGRERARCHLVAYRFTLDALETSSRFGRPS